VPFGGDAGKKNFNGMNHGSYVEDGKLDTSAPTNAMCLLYQAFDGSVSF
jgi:hypothetical protein